MIEQIKNIIKELHTSNQHLVALCSITGDGKDHSVHLLVLTDSNNSDETKVLVDEGLEATVEDFMTEIDTINEETIGGQLQAYIPDWWAVYYGYNGNEMEKLKEILNDVIDHNDWSLNDEVGIGFRIEIK